MDAPSPPATAPGQTNICTFVWRRFCEKVAIPEVMGTPRADQMLGSELDQLIELSGRVCYDSLSGSKSRNSTDYHAHINEVRHHSTHEHAVITVEGHPDPVGYMTLLEAVANRPGVWLSGSDGRDVVRVTANLRAVREWFAFPALNRRRAAPWGLMLQRHAAQAAPLACGDLPATDDNLPDFYMVAPHGTTETWASLHFQGVSRGLTHELVRHKWQTAVSQRSTRFVPESASAWAVHPAVAGRPWAEAMLAQARDACRPLYDAMARRLEAQLKAEAQTRADPAAAALGARKQARGAARGLLGNALESQLIFSASLSQWSWMLKKRCSDAADAEIRLAFNDVFRILQAHFADYFADPALWSTRPAADGMGFVVACQD